MWALVLTATVLVSFLALRSPSLKGLIGEARVRRALSSVAGSAGGRLLHDVTLPDYDSTTRIDHLLISPSGVFVVETKNYRGWIYGSPRRRQWTQVLWRRKYRFLNPLLQNYKHLKAVQSHTGLRSDQLHSLVIFAGSSEFRSEMPPNVISLQQLRDYMLQHRLRASTAALTQTEISAIVTRLEQQRLPKGLVTSWRHRRHIREILRRPVCPRCSSRMLVRAARRGPEPGRQFWGCSRYPRCNGTRTLEN